MKTGAGIKAFFLAAFAAALVPNTVRALDGSEFPEETAAIVAATSALFDAVEAEAAPEERVVPDFSIEGLATPAALPLGGEIAGAFPLTHGPVRHLTGYRINWYPVDRFLGAVDFMGTYDGNRNLVCGYVMWDLSDPDSPVLDGVEANYLDLDALAKVSPAEAHETLLEANCAYGEIEPNFRVFEPS